MDTNEVEKGQEKRPDKKEVTMGFFALVYSLVLLLTLSNTLFGCLAMEHDGWIFIYMFTHQSNILVLVWLILFGISTFCPKVKFRKFIHNRTVMTAVTVYISITFFIVAGVLEPFYKAAFNPLNSFFHHFSSAIVMWIYFFIVPGEGELRYRNAFYILIYPFVFLFCNLIIGGTVSWQTEGWEGNPAYAYDFINPGFYPNIFVFIIVMIVLVGIFAGLGLLLIKFKRWLIKNYH